MSRSTRKNGVASPGAWKAAMLEDRVERAEHLRLPSGATILAVRPDPLDWVLSGRIPQQLLGVALQGGEQASDSSGGGLTRDEILDLADFARQLVKASVVKPAIGDGPDEIALDEIPVKDRAFIFEWACRALKETDESQSPKSKVMVTDSGIIRRRPSREEFSSEKLERFREK